jgi:hypothetical protein
MNGAMLKSLAEANELTPNRFNVTILFDLSPMMSICIADGGAQRFFDAVTPSVDVLASTHEALVITFNMDGYRCESFLSPQNAADFVKQQIAGKFSFGALSYYAGLRQFQVLRALDPSVVTTRVVKRKEIVILLVGRNCNDATRTQELLTQLPYDRVFIHAIGVGPTRSFGFLERMATTMRSNLRFQYVDGFGNLTPELIAHPLFENIRNWLKTVN